VEQELPAQVLGGAQCVLPARQVALVGDRRMPALARRGNRLAAPADRPRHRPHQAGQRAQQRRLAAAVRAAELDPLARAEREPDVPEQRADAGRAGEVLDLEAVAGGDDRAAHGTTWSTRTTRSVAASAPGATGSLTPKRSPDAGVASPLALIRTSTTTSGASDSGRWASIDWASPRAKRPSNSERGARVAAKGMRGPVGARALTKTVASSGSWARRPASISTWPATRGDAAGAAPGRSPPRPARTSRIWAACSPSGSSWARSASRCLRASTMSPAWNMAAPIRPLALGSRGSTARAWRRSSTGRPANRPPWVM